MKSTQKLITVYFIVRKHVSVLDKLLLLNEK